MLGIGAAASAAGAGMAGGAGMGAGGIVGGLTGGVGGYFAAREERKQQQAMEKTRKKEAQGDRFRAFHDRLDAIQQQRTAGQMTLAQSAFNWAGNLR